MAEPKKKKPGHVVINNNAFRCLHCGEELKFPESSKGGFSLKLIAGMCKLVETEHRKCKPSPAGKARFEYSSPDEWSNSWDTGTSSQTIYAMLSGHKFLPESRESPPRDPSDFGRCYRLLKVAPPEWRSRLDEVSKRFPTWKPMVAAWDELTALYEEEIPAGVGSAPKLYARMQELRA